MTQIKGIVFVAAYVLLAGGQAVGQSSADSTDVRIRAAVMAAPADLRDKATVLGYDSEGKFGSLRIGQNNLVCVADDPSSEGFNVSCYHSDLEPYMARGRELRAAGRLPEDVLATRSAEVEAGILTMPVHPTTLYVLSGKEGRYNAAADSIEGAKLRFVIYVPYATPESTGLPVSPTAPGEPWLMDPGTHRAHIMIMPP
ncbi:MAG TPA: hypothetical protein VMO47_05560 [Rhodothermales bacterium]|nr:hypothetical protein [Rhodothermales bacterium]